MVNVHLAYFVLLFRPGDFSRASTEKSRVRDLHSTLIYHKLRGSAALL